MITKYLTGVRQQERGVCSSAGGRPHPQCAMYKPQVLPPGTFQQCHQVPSPLCSIFVYFLIFSLADLGFINGGVVAAFGDVVLLEVLTWDCMEWE